jgi:hypothetical protein
MNGPPEYFSHILSLVILTNGKDLLFAHAGYRANQSKKQVLHRAQG